MKDQPIIIGIAGGSGSGKTTVTRKVYDQIKRASITVIEQDDYYKDQRHLPFEERKKTNFDHPLAFDNDLLIKHLGELKKFKSIDKPTYDYANHLRSAKTVTIQPKDVIILEGILVLEDERLRDLMDIKVFVDTDSDLRIIRRLKRDIEDRGRSIDSVIDQYTRVVRPMHLQFVEPSKRYADIVIPEGGRNNVAIDLLTTKIQSIIERNQS